MTDLEILPISLVAHTMFCERRAWLESVGETVSSLAIEQGVADHRRVDQRRDERLAQRRSVTVAHAELGLIGRCDVLDIDERGGIKVVEFKSSPLRRRSEVTSAQVLQLALQRLCLEDGGHSVVGQAVHFTTQHQTVEVTLDAEDLASAVGYVHRTRQIITGAQAPPSLVDDPRCGGCSHASVCLPDERTEQPTRRRISVPDPDGHVLHVTTPGARVSLRKGRLVTTAKGEELGSLPIERVQGLVVHGNVDVSSAAIRELLWNSRCVVWCSGRGRLVGYASSTETPNGLPRVRQHVASANGHMPLARELISSKIANQATQLRRNSREQMPEVITRMRHLSRLATAAKSVDSLFGIEGDAAAIYFRWFASMISPGGGSNFAAKWTGRTGRGARDEVNVALNLVYGLLLGDTVRAVVAAGLDPHAGFVHSSSRNKPALALDLMEQFRPVIADSVVLSAINNGELTTGMFTSALGDVRLRDDGRRALVSAYERRAQTEFKHPVFGYRVTWRRAMEVQARMVLGVLDGSQDTYIGVRVR